MTHPFDGRRTLPIRQRWTVTLLVICLATVGMAGSPGHAEPTDVERMLPESSVKAEQRVPARFGRGLRVSADYEPLRLSRGLEVAKGFTFDTWFLIEKRTPQATIFSADAYGNCQFVIRNSEELMLAYPGTRVRAQQRLETNRWYHLAVRLEPGKRASIFLDGRLVAHREEKVTALPNGANIRALGAWRLGDRNGYRNHFEGIIDRPRHWTRILSDDEIVAAYREGCQQAAVVPLPQQVVRQPGGGFRPQGRVDLSVDPSLARGNSFAVAAVRDAVTASSPQARVSVGERRPEFQNPSIVVARPTDENLKSYLDLGADRFDELPEEGYALFVRDDRVVIFADDRRGAQHGLMSLKQLVEHDDLAAMDIWDYPAYPFRGTMLLDDGKPPYRFNGEHRQMIDRMAELKQNQFSLRSHAWLTLADPDAYEQMKQLVDHARSRGVEVSPYIQAYSHAKGFLWQDLKTGHTNAVDNETGTFGDDDLLELQHRNVVLNAVTPIEVALHGEPLEPGRDYEVVPGVTEASWSGHPEGTRYTWAKPHVPEDNEPWRLRRLDGGRISPGATVQVSYAYASGHETTCPFMPETWERLEDSIRRSLELTRAAYLNLGMDEIWVIRHEECRACQQNPMSPEQTTLYAMNRGYEVAKQVDPDVQVMLWADMLDDYFMANWAVPLDAGLLDELYGQGVISNEIIMMPWEYHGWVHSKRRGLQFMHDRGFPVVAAAGFGFDNNLIWGEAAQRIEPWDGGVRGILFTTWDSRKFEQWTEGLEGHAMMSWSPHRQRFAKTYELLQSLDPLNELPAPPVDRGMKLRLQALHAEAQRELDQVDPALTQHVQGLVDLRARVEKAGTWIDQLPAAEDRAR